MATKLYDLIIATSEYKDRNGNTKRHWENVGSLLQDKDSNGNDYKYIMLKRIFNPAGINAREGADSVRISLSKPNNNNNQAQQQQAGDIPQFMPPQNQNIEDIPF